MNKVLYRFLYLVAVVGFGGGVLLIVSGREGVGFAAVGVGFLAILAIGLTAVVRGLAAGLEGQRRILVPEAALATPDQPTQIDGVVSAVEALNDPAQPYEITAERSATGAVIKARWRTQELQWQNMFTRGQERLLWKMEVTLDPTKAHYRFTEWSGTAKRDVSVGPGGVHGETGGTWNRGKTAGQLKFRFVMVAGGTVTASMPEGPRTSWDGSIMIKPRDVKIPVFRTLRNHGWRPRHDWWGARMFEA